MGDMALFAQRMRGMVIGSNRYGGGVKVLLRLGLGLGSWCQGATRSICAILVQRV